MKHTLKCKTTVKAKIKFKKHERKEMNQKERRKSEALIYDAQREMLGDDADYFEMIGYDNFGCK